MPTLGTEHSDLISYRIRSGASAEGGFCTQCPEFVTFLVIPKRCTECPEFVTFLDRSGVPAEGGFVGRLPEAGVAVEVAGTP